MIPPAWRGSVKWGTILAQRHVAQLLKVVPPNSMEKGIIFHKSHISYPVIFHIAMVKIAIFS